MPRPAVLVLGLVLFTANASAQFGSVIRSLKVGDQMGGFGDLRFRDFFGCSVAPLGDLNGDGVADLAVGASGGTAIWILFLRADGTVQTFTEINLGGGGRWYGRRLAAVGDLDGDGLGELATTTSNGLWLLFLNADGTLKSLAQNLFSDPVFVPATQASYFEYTDSLIRTGGLCALGDLDGDGIGDLAVGSPGDPEGVLGGFQVGSIWILRLNSNGSIKAAQKIGQTRGGFPGGLQYGDSFGSSLTLLGDLDSDGSPEIGVGSAGGPTLGRFWVLSLDPSGMTLDADAFGAGNYSLRIGGSELFPNEGYAALGDLDGDGVSEVAMSFAQRNFPGAPQNDGGFAVGFLRADGSVRKRLAVGKHRGGFGIVVGGNRFGECFASLGDLDGDGAQEIAVGGPQEDGSGAVWILSLDPDTQRNGSGVNPVTLTQASEPVFGASWTATLDCSAHTSGIAALWGFDRARSGVFTPYGEVLIEGNRVFQLLGLHASGPVVFTRTLPPPSVALIDLPIFIQGACSGAPGAQLSNALDVLIGE